MSFKVYGSNGQERTIPGLPKDYFSKWYVKIARFRSLCKPISEEGHRSLNHAEQHHVATYIYKYISPARFMRNKICDRKWMSQFIKDHTKNNFQIPTGVVKGGELMYGRGEKSRKAHIARCREDKSARLNPHDMRECYYWDIPQGDFEMDIEYIRPKTKLFKDTFAPTVHVDDATNCAFTYQGNSQSNTKLTLLDFTYELNLSVNPKNNFNKKLLQKMISQLSTNHDSVETIKDVVLAAYQTGSISWRKRRALKSLYNYTLQYLYLKEDKMDDVDVFNDDDDNHVVRLIQYTKDQIRGTWILWTEMDNEMTFVDDKRSVLTKMIEVLGSHVPSGLYTLEYINCLRWIHYHVLKCNLNDSFVRMLAKHVIIHNFYMYICHGRFDSRAINECKQMLNITDQDDVTLETHRVFDDAQEQGTIVDGVGCYDKVCETVGLNTFQYQGLFDAIMSSQYDSGKCIKQAFSEKLIHDHLRSCVECMIQTGEKFDERVFVYLTHASVDELHSVHDYINQCLLDKCNVMSLASINALYAFSQDIAHLLRLRTGKAPMNMYDMDMYFAKKNVNDNLTSHIEITKRISDKATGMFRNMPDLIRTQFMHSFSDMLSTYTRTLGAIEDVWRGYVMLYICLENFHDIQRETKLQITPSKLIMCLWDDNYQCRVETNMYVDDDSDYNDFLDIPDFEYQGLSDIITSTINAPSSLNEAANSISDTAKEVAQTNGSVRTFIQDKLEPLVDKTTKALDTTTAMKEKTDSVLDQCSEFVTTMTETVEKMKDNFPLDKLLYSNVCNLIDCIKLLLVVLVNIAVKATYHSFLLCIALIPTKALMSIIGTIKSLLLPRPTQVDASTSFEYQGFMDCISDSVIGKILLVIGGMIGVKTVNPKLVSELTGYLKVMDSRSFRDVVTYCTNFIFDKIVPEWVRAPIQEYLPFTQRQNVEFMLFYAFGKKYQEFCQTNRQWRIDIVNDSRIASQVDVLIKDAENLLTHYPKVYVYYQNQIYRPLQQMYKELITHYNLAPVEIRDNRFRAKPFCFFSWGPSGIGKSTTISEIVTQLVLKNAGLSNNVAEHVYERNTATEYWDGYNNQAIVAYNDFIQCLDETSVTSVLNEFTQVVDEAVYRLNMAQCDAKASSYMRCQAVLFNAQTNICNIDVVTSLTQSGGDHIARRIDYGLEVQPNKKYLQKGGKRVDWNKVAAVSDSSRLFCPGVPDDLFVMRKYKDLKKEISSDTFTSIKDFARDFSYELACHNTKSSKANVRRNYIVDAISQFDIPSERPNRSREWRRDEPKCELEIDDDSPMIDLELQGKPINIANRCHKCNSMLDYAGNCYVCVDTPTVSCDYYCKCGVPCYKEKQSDLVTATGMCEKCVNSFETIEDEPHYNKYIVNLHSFTGNACTKVKDFFVSNKNVLFFVSMLSTVVLGFYMYNKISGNTKTIKQQTGEQKILKNVRNYRPYGKGKSRFNFQSCNTTRVKVDPVEGMCANLFVGVNSKTQLVNDNFEWQVNVVAVSGSCFLITTHQYNEIMKTIKMTDVNNDNMYDVNFVLYYGRTKNIQSITMSASDFSLCKIVDVNDEIMMIDFPLNDVGRNHVNKFLTIKALNVAGVSEIVRVARDCSDVDEHGNVRVVGVYNSDITQCKTDSIRWAGGIMTKIIHAPTLQTKSGDCGSIYVTNDMKVEGSIVGIHVGKQTGGGGVAKIVSREEVEEALAEIGGIQLQGNVIVYRESKFKETLIDAVPEVMPIGVSDLRNSMNGINKVTDTPFTEYLEVHRGPPVDIPSQLRPFKNDQGEVVSPMFKALEKAVCMPTHTEALSIEQVDRAVYQVYVDISNMPESNKLVERPIPSVVEAIGQVFDLRPMDLKTSVGFPYVQEGFTKKDIVVDGEIADTPAGNIFMSRYENRLELAKNGIVAPTVFSDNLKDETRPIAKVAQGKTRLFHTAPFDLQVLIRQYFGSLLSLLQNSYDNGEMKIGINVDSHDWERLYKDLIRFGTDTCFAGDFSNFDSSIPVFVMRKFSDFANKWYDDGKENAKIRRVLVDTLCAREHLVADTLHFRGKGNPSGNALTTPLNCFCLMVLFRCCFEDLTMIDLSHFQKYVELAVYGDDNISGVDSSIAEVYNFSNIKQWFSKIGMTLTVADKSDSDTQFENIHDLTFLKRKFHPKNNIVHSPLEKQDLYGCLRYSVVPDTHAEDFSNIAHQIQRFHFHEGKDAFDEATSFLVRMFRETGVPLDHNQIKTYNQVYKDMYVKNVKMPMIV